MVISEAIIQLENMKKIHGDLPVCIRDHCEEYQFPFMELENIDYCKHEKVIDEDTGKEEILTFIALDYM